MDALTYIGEKYSLERQIAACRTTGRGLPIAIPDTNRETLARLFFLLEFQRGVEVGVERGMFSEVICRANPGVDLTCVDPWKSYRGYRDHVDQGKLDRFFVETQERLAPFKRARLLRKFSVDAAKDFADGSLDFVYLDGNHNIQNVIADLAAWSPKVRQGGIIAGHDYARHKWPNQIHVVYAVQAWTKSFDISPWFVLGSDAKVDGQLRDDARSFFWINEPRPVIARGKPVQQ